MGHHHHGKTSGKSNNDKTTSRESSPENDDSAPKHSKNVLEKRLIAGGVGGSVGLDRSNS